MRWAFWERPLADVAFARDSPDCAERGDEEWDTNKERGPRGVWGQERAQGDRSQPNGHQDQGAPRKALSKGPQIGVLCP